MRKPKVLLTLLSLFALGGIGYATFFAASSLKSGGSAEAEPQTPPEVFEEERQKPRFQGELLGIFIAPRGVATPEEFAPKFTCDTRAELKRVDEAGELDMALNLSDNYKLDENSLNTGVSICNGKVFAARWAYTVTVTSTGYPGEVLISRNPSLDFTADVAEDRVKTLNIEGREAIVAEPITANGISSWSAVIFPEPFGKTSIQAAGLALEDLMEVARAVALATK